MDAMWKFLALWTTSLPQKNPQYSPLLNSFYSFILSYSFDIASMECWRNVRIFQDFQKEQIS